jgi:polyferredoxin
MGLTSVEAIAAPAGGGAAPEARKPRYEWTRTFRIVDARVLSQATFLGLFAFAIWVTWFSRLEGYPVSLFLEIDPLVALATSISTGTVYRNLWWSLWILVPTLLLGRVFCNWVCPYGTLHQFTGWVLAKFSGTETFDKNRYRPLFRTKYVILTVFLVLAGFGSLQIGLLDPICLTHRSATVSFAPAWDKAVGGAQRVSTAVPDGALVSPGAKHPRIYKGATFIGWMMLVLLGMNLWIPRFFCRVLCPLGALLGSLSRFALWRIDRDVQKCTDCDLCLRSCEGASDPHLLLRQSECFVCFNCIEDCPEDALSFRFAPPRESGIEHTDSSKRRLLYAGAAAAFTWMFFRTEPEQDDRTYTTKYIRPPGSPAEKEFLERCIKCDQCMKVCPTNVLQPLSWTEGLEAMWTPVMDMRAGYCELNCTLCGHVCPTGAILPISIEEKLGLGSFSEQGPVSVGTAFFDKGRCLPHAMETPCVVCEEVCPVSPKAIGTYEERITRWDGAQVLLNKPYIRPELCIGCGICEHECPVTDSRAVYVTPVGETRSKERSLLLNRKVKV